MGSQNSKKHHVVMAQMLVKNVNLAPKLGLVLDLDGLGHRLLTNCDDGIMM